MLRSICIMFSQSVGVTCHFTAGTSCDVKDFALTHVHFGEKCSPFVADTEKRKKGKVGVRLGSLIKASDGEKKSKMGGGEERGSLMSQTGGNNYPSLSQWSLIYASPIKVSGWLTKAMQVCHWAVKTQLHGPYM